MPYAAHTTISHVLNHYLDDDLYHIISHTGYLSLVIIIHYFSCILLLRQLTSIVIIAIMTYHRQCVYVRMVRADVFACLLDACVLVIIALTITVTVVIVSDHGYYDYH